MISSLSHSELKKALLLSAELGIGANTATPIEWAKFMGLPEDYHHFNIGRHVGEVGRGINDCMGFDFIATHFPKWRTNSKQYRAYGSTPRKVTKAVA